MTLDHPKVKKIIRQCQRRVQKLTGNSAVLILFHNPKKVIPYEDVIQAICTITGIPLEEIVKRRRKREYVIARQLVCYYAKNYSRMYHREIGQKMGYKDHTTSVSGIKVIKNLIETNDEYVIDAVTRINDYLKVYS